MKMHPPGEPKNGTKNSRHEFCRIHDRKQKIHDKDRKFTASWLCKKPMKVHPPGCVWNSVSSRLALKYMLNFFLNIIRIISLSFLQKITLCRVLKRSEKKSLVKSSSQPEQVELPHSRDIASMRWDYKQHLTHRRWRTEDHILGPNGPSWAFADLSWRA